jgi:outer membrane protein
MHRPVVTLVAVSFFSARAAGAQHSLHDALQQADRSAFGNRIAAGATAAQTAQSLSPLKGILPSVRFEAGYVRTSDPIGVFGATLRQRTITQADFDPQRLNHPNAVGNYQGGIVVEQPVFNADAWTGRRAALRAADASRASEDWTRLSTRVDVIRAYYGTVLAAERASTLRSAARGANAHVTQAEAMVRQGLVTKSDALLASVRAGEIEAELAESDGNAVTAGRQLAVLLGGDGAELPGARAASAALPAADRIRAVVTADTAAVPGQLRSDVQAASLGLEAAQADSRRARSAYLPRINSFARYDWNSANRLYSGDKNWTVGIMSSWTPFAGASELADVQLTAAHSASAQAQAEAASANARLDVEETRTALIVALARLTIAERSVAQSAEAHRIVARKYEGGLATVAELLDAQTAETHSALGFAQARYAAIVAAAERRRALGKDPATLETLDDPDLRKVS